MPFQQMFFLSGAGLFAVLAVAMLCLIAYVRRRGRADDRRLVSACLLFALGYASEALEHCFRVCDVARPEAHRATVAGWIGTAFLTAAALNLFIWTRRRKKASSME